MNLVTAVSSSASAVAQPARTGATSMTQWGTMTSVAEVRPPASAVDPSRVTPGRSVMPGLLTGMKKTSPWAGLETEKAG